MALDPRSPFSQLHPLAGKITAGVRTTENRARLPHQTMQLAEMPVIQMADRAQQMFSMTDTKGTRVYYSNLGVFNTVDEAGKSINFIQGLFKTDNLKVIRYLQQFVENGTIHYLELQEDPSDAIPSNEPTRERRERQPGSTGSEERPLQLDNPESERREEPTTEADRSGSGGEGQENAEQPTLRPAFSSESADRHDGSQPGRQDDTDGAGELPVAPVVKPLSLSERMKAKQS